MSAAAVRSRRHRLGYYQKTLLLVRSVNPHLFFVESRRVSLYRSAVSERRLWPAMQHKPGEMIGPVMDCGREEIKEGSQIKVPIHSVSN
jgi:hypothetical protein